MVGRAAALAMAILGAGLVLAGRTAAAQSAPAPAARPSVIVVPFGSDGRDPREYWLREASAVIVTDDLVSLGVSAMSREERLSRIRVASRARRRQPQSRDGHPRGPGRWRGARHHRLLRHQRRHHHRARAVDSARDRATLGRDCRDRSAHRALRRVRPNRPSSGDRHAARDGQPGDRPSACRRLRAVHQGTARRGTGDEDRVSREALRLDPSLQPARIAIWSVYTELGEHQTALTDRASGAGLPTTLRARPAFWRRSRSCISDAIRRPSTR